MVKEKKYASRKMAGSVAVAGGASQVDNPPAEKSKKKSRARKGGAVKVGGAVTVAGAMPVAGSLSAKQLSSVQHSLRTATRDQLHRILLSLDGKEFNLMREIFRQAYHGSAGAGYPSFGKAVHPLLGFHPVVLKDMAHVDSVNHLSRILDDEHRQQPELGGGLWDAVRHGFHAVTHVVKQGADATKKFGKKLRGVADKGMSVVRTGHRILKKVNSVVPVPYMGEIDKVVDGLEAGKQTLDHFLPAADEQKKSGPVDQSSSSLKPP